MRIKKTATAALAIAGGLVTALTLSACGQAPSTEGSASSVDFKACAVSGAGGWKDKSFNEQVYSGLEAAKDELGVETIAFESKTSDDFVPGISSLVDQGCDLIFSVGFDANDAVNDAATANPDIDFVTVDGFVKDDSVTNLKAVSYKMDQSSFLGGYVAAAHSTSHVIGTFGAIQNSAITDFMTGYYNGAQQWAKDNNTPTKVLGWDPATEAGVFVGDFENQVSAKTISSGQLNQGADVLFPVAGPLFAGAAEAISESGAEATFMGVDSDIAVTNPKYASITLTSVEKRMTKAVQAIIADAVEGQFDSEPYVGDLENEGTGLAPFHDFDSSVSNELKSRLDELTQQIISGELSTNG